MEKVKEDIKENAIKITEEEKRKANKLIRGLKRDMETQSRRFSSKNTMTGNKTKAKEEFLFLKSSLSKIGNEKLETAKESA